VKKSMANDFKFSLTNQLPMITKMLPKNFEKAMLKSAITVNNEVKRVLTGTRSGHTYRVPATKKTWIASAPNEPPAIRLGDLRQQYNYKVLGNGFNAIGYVGNPLPYSAYLEFGTKNIAPRPHLRVAFKNTKEKVFKNFEDLM
jgi:HK97 gp10 family phage protein